MSEHNEWLAARDLQSVKKSEQDDILYRRHENNEQAAAAADDSTGLCATDPAAADGDDDDDACHLFADPELDRAFADTMGHVICQLRAEWCDAIKAERDGHERAL